MTVMAQGIKAALRAIPILKEVGITAKVINMDPYKDPDEFIKASWGRGISGANRYRQRTALCLRYVCYWSRSMT